MDRERGGARRAWGVPRRPAPARAWRGPWARRAAPASARASGSPRTSPPRQRLCPPQSSRTHRTGCTPAPTASRRGLLSIGWGGGRGRRLRTPSKNSEVSVPWGGASALGTSAAATASPTASAASASASSGRQQTLPSSPEPFTSSPPICGRAGATRARRQASGATAGAYRPSRPPAAPSPGARLGPPTSRLSCGSSANSWTGGLLPKALSCQCFLGVQ